MFYDVSACILVRSKDKEFEIQQERSKAWTAMATKRERDTQLELETLVLKHRFKRLVIND